MQNYIRARIIHTNKAARSADQEG